MKAEKVIIRDRLTAENISLMSQAEALEKKAGGLRENMEHYIATISDRMVEETESHTDKEE